MCSRSVSSTCSTSVTQRRMSGADNICAWGVKFSKLTIHDKISALSEIYLILEEGKKIVPHVVKMPQLLFTAPSPCLFYIPGIILSDIR